MSLPTALDHMHAMFYALDRIAKERCQDTDILAKYPGLIWESKDNNRIYPCPTGVTQCEHGSCRIGTKQVCDASSQIPWQSDGKMYPSVSCKKTDDCKNVGYNAICSSGGNCIPAKPYLEWHPDYKYADTGKCVIGNIGLRRWCENPSSRRDSSEAGVTDVPPFKYDENTGNCLITPEYCAWMGVDYEASDSNGVPSCSEGTGQQIGEFFIGKTIFKGLKRVTENFDILPNQVTKCVDEQEMSRKTLIGKDFGGSGINLYQISWKNGDKPISGFISSEIESRYPQLITKNNGKKTLVISRDQIQNDKYLKRIYLTAGSGNWILESLLKIYNKAK